MPDPTTKWNYALDLSEKEAATSITVERTPMPTKWDWPLAAPLKLLVNAVSCEWTLTLEKPLPVQSVVKQTPTEKIVLIPYGCTKFRVSMFPVTAAAQ